MLSITTDGSSSRDCPRPYLRQIAEAGFSHVMWCHQWDTDYLYGDNEIAQIGGWMRELGLSLTDIHASAGTGNQWLSRCESLRQAGVALIKNRVEMAARLGSDVIVLHVRRPRGWTLARVGFFSRLRRSLDKLTNFGASHGVRIALENLFPSNFDLLAELFELYSPDVLGLCYDAGHGLIVGDGLDRLERMKDRLISMHLHDNNGKDDQHMLLFSGGVDWAGLARLIAQSGYNKPISMEVMMKRHKNRDPADFLAEAFETGNRFSEMIAAERQTGNRSE